MKAFSRVGLLLALALLASAAVGASAQAVTITPDNTAVTGLASNPVLTYQGTNIVCDTGTAAGTTGTGSDRISNLAVTFQGNCTIAGLNATVTCSGTATLIALTATGGGSGTGTTNLNTGFNCTVSVSGICNVTVSGPQTTGSSTTFNATTDRLTASVPVNATRTGSSLCGPASGAAAFDAVYATSPANLSIDP